MMKYLQKRHHNTVLFVSLCLLAALASCKEGDAVFSDIDNPTYDFRADREVPVDIFMSISSVRPTETRLSNFVTQVNQSTARLVTDFHIIPYGVTGRKIQADDTPYYGSVGSMASVTADAAYHYYGEAFDMPIGTASFLCYCRAVPETSSNKVTNGSIVLPNLNNRVAPSNYTFSPDVIHPDLDDTTTPASPAVHETAQRIADYMTSIAHAGGWPSSTDPSWQMLFQYFTNESELIAGSSSSVKAFITELKKGVDEQESSELKTAVLAAIDFTNLDTHVPADFPASIGLPDGSAVLRWNALPGKMKFEVQTQATTIKNMVSQDLYVYPPELYFYANSQIQTANRNISISEYSGKTWAQVLELYPNGNIVTAATRGIAVQDQLRYGVSCLKATVKANAATLLDADDKAVTLGTDKFPLTGLLMSGQYKQDFTFTPTSDATEYVLYDKSFSGVYLRNFESPDTPPAFSTLSFQSKEITDPVWFAIEFQNNSEEIFRGNNGLIYPGTKFYLVGAIYREKNPTEGVDWQTRVFTKGHITEIEVTVNSLKNAYNVVPDLLSGRLEVGVQLVTNWIEVTTTDVVLK
ncbi:MAG: hypothetical protein K5945_08630 [Bacteroidaceae bacterium]|nr:hypothetical protein [Bacteroidaceae bacterium]